MAASFSYAQAAKGQATTSPSTKPSSTAPSGTATPASTALTETPPASSAHDPIEHAHQNTATSKPNESSTAADSAKPSSRTAQSTNRNHDGTSSIDTDSVNDSVFSKDTKSETKSETKASSLASPAAGATGEDGDKSAAVDDGQEQAKPPPKPVYHEARPPSVNIWAQRAADFKSKQPAPAPQAASHTSQPPAPLTGRASAPHTIPSSSGETDRQKSDYRRKSEQGPNREARRGDATTRPPRDDVKNSRNRRDAPRAEDSTTLTRRSPPKPRERAGSEVAPPSVNSPVAWPKPEDSQADEKKRQEDKDRSASMAKPHGKTEWKHMPYTPTAVFETRIEGKAGPRVGKGSAKPGPPLNTRPSPAVPASADSARSPTKANGEHNGNAADRPQAERPTDQGVADVTSTAGAAPDTAKVNHDVHKSTRHTVNGLTESTQQKPSTANVTAAPSQLQLDATLNFEPAQNGYTPKRTPAHLQTDASFRSSHSSDFDGQTPRSAYNERRSEPHIYDAHRDPGSFSKRGGRKGPGRGGFANGSFGSPNNFVNGFQDFGGPHIPGASPPTLFSGRGSGRGYRNQGMRSQSIPIDTSFGRPMPSYAGYPVPPMHQFVPDYYAGPYSAGPVPGGPNMDREYLVASVLNQVEYYFSIDNLLKDIYLRKHMDSKGWIELQVVAGFNRMKTLTMDYNVLKTACLQSGDIEIRVGDDGKERLRKVRDWEQWVLPTAERDPAAQHDGLSSLRSISPVRAPMPEHQPMYSPGPMPPHSASRVMEHSFHIQDGASAPFFPGAFDGRSAQNGYTEESRGRQSRGPIRKQGAVSPLSAGFPEAGEDAEPDRFPSTQIENLTVLVRKGDVPSARPAHSPGSRTFSNGSIKSGDLIDSVAKAEETTAPATNGVHEHDGPTSDSHASAAAEDKSDLSLFWVKDQDQPIDEGALPSDTTHELYTTLRAKALQQREAASTGNCPYDLDVLYQFWSHFLVRNFNSRMYHEFKTLATEDAQHRHNDNGLKSLIAYYNGTITSQVTARDAVIKDFAALIMTESGKVPRPAFSKLRESWLDHSYNLKNRKKLSDALDESIKAELGP